MQKLLNTGSVAAAAMAALVALSIVGCAAQPTPTPTSSPTNTHPATQAPAPVPTSTPGSASPTCEELVPSSVLDDALGGSFALNASFTPSSGSAAGEIVDAGGTACEWSNADGVTVLLAAGAPSEDVAAAGKSEASRAGESTDAFGSSVDSFLSGEGGTTIDVFTRSEAWVHAESAAFTSVAAAQSIIASALQELPSGA